MKALPFFKATRVPRWLAALPATEHGRLEEPLSKNTNRIRIILICRTP